MAGLLSPTTATDSTQEPKTVFKTGTMHRPESGILSPQSTLILRKGTLWHSGGEQWLTDEKAFVAGVSSL